MFQYTRNSILVSVITVILRASNDDLMAFPLCALFALVSISLRTLVGLSERLYTVVLILFSSVFISKQRLEHNWVLFGELSSGEIERRTYLFLKNLLLLPTRQLYSFASNTYASPDVPVGVHEFLLRVVFRSELFLGLQSRSRQNRIS